MIDTTVYIGRAAGTLPDAVRSLLDRSRLYHSTVCLSELAVGIGALPLSHPRRRDIVSHYEELFAEIPASRLVLPDSGTWNEAGLIAGTLARLQGLQPLQRKQCLNDALILLSAAKAGHVVLTANRRDFDLLQQLAPETRYVWYGSGPSVSDR
ncbi:MAG: type II toxin-antitoxin system VapC family toxin [Salinarimonas sp.]